MQFSKMWGILAPLALALVLTPTAASAQDALDTGDTAWILISTGLVLFMMIPGLAMFYAGLVRTRNVLSVFMHCFGITALITILWTVCGYSRPLQPTIPSSAVFPRPSSAASPATACGARFPKCYSSSSR